MTNIVLEGVTWRYMKSTPLWLNDFLESYEDTGEVEAYINKLVEERPDIQISWLGPFEPMRVWLREDSTDYLSHKEAQEILEELKVIIRENPPLRLAALLVSGFDEFITGKTPQGHNAFMSSDLGIIEDPRGNYMVFRVPVFKDDPAPTIPDGIVEITQEEFASIPGVQL